MWKKLKLLCKKYTWSPNPPRHWLLHETIWIVPIAHWTLILRRRWLLYERRLPRCFRSSAILSPRRCRVIAVSSSTAYPCLKNRICFLPRLQNARGTWVLASTRCRLISTSYQHTLLTVFIIDVPFNFHFGLGGIIEYNSATSRFALCTR